MHHPDLHISFTGIVIGILLGVGIVTFAGQTELSANTAAVSRAPAVSILRSAPTRADFVRRNIVRKDIPLRNDDGVNTYITVKTESSVGSAKAEAPTTCDAVRKAVEKIRRVYADVVAEAVGNVEIRQRMYDVIADASDDGCTK